MNLSRIFIERPVMTALICFAILLFGAVAFRALPVAALPSVDYPTIQVAAALPGASPETMPPGVRGDTNVRVTCARRLRHENFDGLPEKFLALVTKQFFRMPRRSYCR